MQSAGVCYYLEAPRYDPATPKKEASSNPNLSFSQEGGAFFTL